MKWWENPLSLTKLSYKNYNIVATEEQLIQYFFTFYEFFSKQIF